MAMSFTENEVVLRKRRRWGGELLEQPPARGHLWSEEKVNILLEVVDIHSLAVEVNLSKGGSGTWISKCGAFPSA